MSNDEPIKIDMRELVSSGFSPQLAFSFPAGVPPDEQSARIRMLLRVASEIRHQNSELCFLRLVQVIFTRNVWETVSNLEQFAEHQLPAARNGAEQMTVFAVDLGPVDVIVIREEWLNFLVANEVGRGRGLWQYTSVLATISYYTLVKAKFAQDAWIEAVPASGPRAFNFASGVMASYWQGYFTWTPALQTVAAFDLLVDTLPEEVRQMEVAFDGYAKDGDIHALESNLHKSVTFLCKSMAIAAGYCDAAQRPLSHLAPDLWVSIQKADFEELWSTLELAVREVFASRQDWMSAIEFIPIAIVEGIFLAKFGIHYGREGGRVVPVFIAPVRSITH